MATIIRLEKDGYMKDAFVGYSYTLLSLMLLYQQQDKI